MKLLLLLITFSSSVWAYDPYTDTFPSGYSQKATQDRLQQDAEQAQAKSVQQATGAIAGTAVDMANGKPPPPPEVLLPQINGVMR